MASVDESPVISSGDGRRALLIRLELEAVPSLIVDCLNEAEEVPLRDWIAANQPLSDLARFALALGEQAV